MTSRLLRPQLVPRCCHIIFLYTNFYKFNSPYGQKPSHARTQLTLSKMTDINHPHSGLLSKRQKKRRARQKAKQLANSTNMSDARETPISAPIGPRSVNLRKSRARRVHQITARPGRGGLTGKGAEQLRRFFSNKTPEGEKPALREMDETALTVMLQLAAEDVDCTGLDHEAMMDVTEKLMIANRPEIRRADDGAKEGEVEGDLKMEEELLEIKDSLGSMRERKSSDTSMGEAVGLWQMTCSHRYK